MLYRSTDKTEATEIVIIDSQMNYRGKLDTYETFCCPLCPSSVNGMIQEEFHIVSMARVFMTGAFLFYAGGHHEIY